MSNRGDGLASLRAIVEKVREGDYPSLDAELVGDILDAQTSYASDRSEAYKRTEQAVGRWVAENAATESKES